MEFYHPKAHVCIWECDRDCHQWVSRDKSWLVAGMGVVMTGQGHGALEPFKQEGRRQRKLTDRLLWFSLLFTYNLFVEETAVGKPVTGRHTNERTQGFSTSFHAVFYSVHLSVVSQSSAGWERGKQIRVVTGAVCICWREWGRECRGNYRLKNVFTTLNCYFPFNMEFNG